mmetsp:Transcript_20695/g.46859  ORF Transcript_20695/g.46859 Transcript_20695/m.46859 type:complete len:324 (+) Transcript_20695:2-973(+)
MVKVLMEKLRSSHQKPVRLATSRPPLTSRGATPWQDLKKRCRPSGAMTQRSRSQRTQDDARERLASAPISEAQVQDPVTFRTCEGWTPVILAVLLQTVDADRSVCPFPLTQGFPDRFAGGSRKQVVEELMAGPASAFAELEEDKPLLLPQRFPDVAQTLVNMAINEFVRLCTPSAAESVRRILHSTLCLACHLNRAQIVRHLLETGLCDPCCTFLPIEQRPLHIVTSHGFGRLAQLLLEKRADPLEADEDRQFPVLKLTQFFEDQLRSLQARVVELEAQLCEASVTEMSPKEALKGPVHVGRKSGGGPVLTGRYESLLHDSRM